MLLLELGLLVVRENAVDEGFGVGGFEHGLKSTRDELAVDAHHRRTASGQMEVGRAVLDGVLEKFGEVHSFVD